VKLNQLVKELQHPGISFNTHSTAGVGLLISKKLVELMGGSISIDSQEDAGTTVKFSVLVRKSPKKPRRLFNLDLPTLKGKKVLIVDDNKTFRNFLKQQLQPWKLDVTTAGSGEEALQQIGESGDFDMAIIDMQMPGMDGVQLAQNIRKSHPALPLMLTNKTGNEAYKKDHSLFNAIVSKPVKQHVFNEQVLGLLRNSDVVETDKPTLSVDFAKKYPLRIILAEDNVMNQKLVTKILNKLGYEPYITSNGKEVLEEVSHNVYDLILMDVQMDEMDGLEATRMIRLCLSVQPIIIAMTANTMQGDREECLQAGMDDYLGKPVKLEELVKIIEKWAIHSRQYNN
jgi:CheY-like chemotaxis protein